ncbi:MAG: hypothetical protein ABI832_23665, partial [bacterium]
MKLIEAVQSALVSAFRISEDDRDIVLDLYEPSRRIVSNSAHFPLEIFPRRSRAASSTCFACAAVHGLVVSRK